MSWVSLLSAIEVVQALLIRRSDRDMLAAGLDFMDQDETDQLLDHWTDC